MKPLMIHVERAVRPVLAEEVTKCNMREELYAHISSIYEEEFERVANEDEAVRVACRRFGDPADLTSELQQSVPRFERCIAKIDHLVRRRKQETLLGHILRMAGSCLLLYALLAVFTLSLAHLLGRASVVPHSGHLDVKIRIFLALGFWFVVNVGAFTAMGYAMRGQLEAGLLRPNSLLLTTALLVLSALTVFLTGWCFLLMILANPAASVPLLPRWCVLAALTPLGFAAVSRLAAIELVRSRPWTSLLLDR